MDKKNWILYVGDALAIAMITLIGFITHDEAELTFLPRMAAVFFPLLLAWFLLALPLGLFRDEVTHHAHQLWRPALSAFFAAPLAVLLRGLILNAPILPIFGIVLSLAFALGMVVWRLIWYWIIKPR